MRFVIDQYAYQSRIRQVDPAYKTLLALTVILLVLIVDSPWASALALLWMTALTVLIVGVPLRIMARLLTAEGLFLALSLVGIVLSFSLAVPAAMPWRTHIGPLWVSSSPAALAQGASLLLRALAGGAAMVFLTLSTPFVDLAELMRRWRVPALLVDLMLIVYRFIFVLFEHLNQMQIAQDSRLGRANRSAMMRSAALLASNLFMDVFRRSARLQIALDSRGYANDLRVLPIEYTRDRRWLLVTAAVTLSLVGAGLL